MGGSHPQFTKTQTQILLTQFEKSREPDKNEIKMLSKTTGLTKVQVAAWFSMRRFQIRRRLPMKEYNNKIKNVHSPRNKRQPKEIDTRVPETLEHCRTHNHDESKLIEKQFKESVEPSVQTDRLDNFIASKESNTSVNRKFDGKRKKANVPEVVIKFRKIREIPLSRFELLASACSLNFQRLLQHYIAAEIEGQEVIENETNRLLELIEILNLHFTEEQEEFLVDVRLEIMNGLLKKATDNQWGEVVAKFHITDMFRGWHHFAVYACIKEVSLDEAIQDLCSGLNENNDDFFVAPSWSIPALLVQE